MHFALISHAILISIDLTASEIRGNCGETIEVSEWNWNMWVLRTFDIVDAIRIVIRTVVKDKHRICSLRYVASAPSCHVLLKTLPNAKLDSVDDWSCKLLFWFSSVVHRLVRMGTLNWFTAHSYRRVCGTQCNNLAIYFQSTLIEVNARNHLSWLDLCARPAYGTSIQFEYLNFEINFYVIQNTMALR